MTKAITYKAVPLALGIAVALSFGSTAFARDISHAGKDISAVAKEDRISGKNARNLVKTLLKREYDGNSYKAGVAQRIGDKWVVKINYRVKKVATAFVDAKSGNIHIQ